MTRSRSLVFATALLALVSTACSSESFDTAAPDDDSAVDGAVSDASLGDAITPGDTAPSDGAPPPCASPPCSCVAPTPVRCGATCVDPKTDIDHCGSCLEACNKVDHGTSACSASKCTLTCDAGYHVCGAACVKSSSLLTCGASCAPCPAPGINASASCDGIKCGVTCYPGFADCNGGTDGCEVDLSSPANCGVCSVACPGTAPNCSPKPGGGFMCTSGCTGTTTLCGTTCVDTSSSPANCGSCGSKCDAKTNARTTCSGGHCGFLCDVGYHACSTSSGSGCVDDFSTDTCGTSCGACPKPPHTTATCDGTACGVACVAGFKDCNGVADDGCEADLSDPKTCGSCTGACPIPAHGTPTCSGGTCGSTCTAPSIPLGDRCALFGGAYEIDSSTCGGACKSTNVFTGACTCPPGFVPEITGASSECDQTSRGQLVICNAPASGTSFPSNVDWGGAYSSRVESCPPNDCLTANPFTGDCSCPGGTSPIAFAVESVSPSLVCSGVADIIGPPLTPSGLPDAISLGATPIDTQLVFCGAGSGGTRPVTFFGGYETLDDGTCSVTNPATSACSCPAKSVDHALRVMTAPPGLVHYCVPG